MKLFTEKRILQKILIALFVFMILFQFFVPNESHALVIVDQIKEGITKAFKDLAKKTIMGAARITADLGDLAMSALNNVMLGTAGYGTAMLPKTTLLPNENIDNENIDTGVRQWFYPDITIPEASTNSDINLAATDIAVVGGENEEPVTVYVASDYISDDPDWIIGSDGWEVPNLLYSPESIFGNNIAMLDVNFLNPNDYDSVVVEGDGYTTAQKRSTSIGESLKGTIANWYKAFRNIAIVALLSILVYLGIRIIISSTAEDKAKYKEIIKDWVIALCLVFLMHFIMSATIMVVNLVNSLFVNANNNIYVHIDGGATFKSNFIGVIRFLAQSKYTEDAWAYTLMYLVLVFYTFSFTLQYLKRVLYIAFYTMIAPLVAITYPIDKLGDGKSQAFNKWFKEYMMTMALQPIHLVIYTVIVSSALALSIESPLYAIVAIGFLIPAEQFIKSLFGVESKADGGFGSFASGALTMKAMDALGRKRIGPPPGKDRDRQDSANSENDDRSKIRQSNNKPLQSLQSLGAGDENTPNADEEENSNINFADNNGINGTDFISGAAAGALATEAANRWDSHGRLIDGQENNNQEQQEENSNDIQPYKDGDGQIYYENGRRMKQYPDGTKADVSDARITAEEAARYKKLEDEQRRKAQQQSGTTLKPNISDAMRRKNMKRQIRKNYGKRAAITGVKMLKKGARFTARAMGATAGATIGIASGIASGKGISAVAQRGLAGAYAGNTIGNNLANAVGRITTGIPATLNAIDRWDRNERITNKELLDGKQAANEYAKKTFKPNTKQRQKFNEIAMKYNAETGQNKSWKDLQSQIYDYESNGISDINKIVKGLTLENKYNNIDNVHDKMVDVMKFAESYGEEYIDDPNKKTIYNNKLDSLGIKGNNRDNMNELFYAINGRDYNKEKQKAEQRQQRQQNQGTNTEPVNPFENVSSPEPQQQPQQMPRTTTRKQKVITGNEEQSNNSNPKFEIAQNIQPSKFRKQPRQQQPNPPGNNPGGNNPN